MIDIEQILKGIDYTSIIDEAEKFCIGTYAILGEALNPSDAYDYTKIDNGWFRYKDIKGITYDVRLTYQPTKEPYFEFKTWFYVDGKPVYNQSKLIEPNGATAKDLDKRSNTVAKIYRDELIPLFKNQDLTNKLVIEPVSPSRYRMSLSLVNKFTPKEFKVIEEFNKKITIIKPE